MEPWIDIAGYDGLYKINPSNVVALCRSCHNDAHGPKSREVKGGFKGTG